MTALAIGTTVIVLLLAVLVVGLLRSYAAVLERLEKLGSTGRPGDIGAQLDPSLPTPSEFPTGARAQTITGVGLRGEPLQVSIAEGAQNTLLAFLTSGCATCEDFWHALKPTNTPQLPSETRILAVTKDPSYESPSRLLEVGAGDVTVIQSSAAWEDYAVPGSPYFVYVDGETATIIGEGTALAWDQVESLLRDAALDSEFQSSGAADSEPNIAVVTAGGETADARLQRAERAFVEAGVPFDDPSLFELSEHEHGTLRE